MNYKMTTLETNIEKLYKFLEIQSPSEIEMYKIAEKLDVWVHHWEHKSIMNCRDGMYSIILDDKKDKFEQWQDFAHELAHVIRHDGNQSTMYGLFKNLQENQANNFMYHFCVPSFMLLNLNINDYVNINYGVDFVSDTFGVTKKFATKRLSRFKNQLIQASSDAAHRSYMNSRYPKAAPYSKETTAIVNRALELRESKERRINFA